jgi:hypothetical protein
MTLSKIRKAGVAVSLLILATGIYSLSIPINFDVPAYQSVNFATMQIGIACLFISLFVGIASIANGYGSGSDVGATLNDVQQTTQFWMTYSQQRQTVEQLERQNQLMAQQKATGHD